jgi:uncharacterized protein
MSTFCFSGVLIVLKITFNNYTLMLQPQELRKELPMEVGGGSLSTTTKVWQVLVASKKGDLETVKKLVSECPGLIYAQYNYTPPIHFAVREGHSSLVKFLLDNGAHDPNYKIYPFSESLQTIAEQRGHHGIASLLNTYASDKLMQKYKGDNGEIHYNRTEEQQEFQVAVDKGGYSKVEQTLQSHPEYAKDETYFWGEGILMMPAKKNDCRMADILMSYGAKVPAVLKWAQFYYFEHLEAASYMMEKGMNPNTMSWHHVTILHDMAQKGFINKAELLINYGADLDPVDEEYQSTPLGLAAKWGQAEMVQFLIRQGADVNKSGARWATPLAWATITKNDEIERILRKSGAV